MVVDDLNARQRDREGLGFLPAQAKQPNNSKVVRVFDGNVTCDEPVRQCWELSFAKI